MLTHWVEDGIRTITTNFTEYDAFGQSTRIQAPSGMVTVVTYDAATATFPQMVAVLGGTALEELQRSSLSHDYRFGAVAAQSDLNADEPSEVMRFKYDTFGRLAEVDIPVSSVEGVPRTQQHITFEHGALPGLGTARARTGYPVPRGALQGPEVWTQVDGFGQVMWTAKTAVINGAAPSYVVSGRQLQDAFGRVVLTGLPENVATMALDSVDVAPLSVPIRRTYDSQDRLTKQVTQMGVAPAGPVLSTVTFTYKLALDAMLIRDASLATGPRVGGGGAKQASGTWRDALGRTVVTVEYPNGYIEGTTNAELVTRYAYRPTGEVSAILDAESHPTLMSYDKLGRLLQTTSLDTGLTTLTYDAAGRFSTRQDARGQLVTNVYEPNSDRLEQIQRVNEQTFTFQYGRPTDPGAAVHNRIGRVRHSTHEAGSVVQSFDILGNVTRTEYQFTGVTTPASMNTTFEWDAFGRLLQMQYPDGEVVGYDYNAAGQVIRAATPGTHVYARDIQYNHFGSRTQMVAPAGVVQKLTYSNFTGRVEDILTHKELTPADTLQHTKLTYDVAGNITSSVTPVMEPVTASDPVVPRCTNSSYVYDLLDRLTDTTTTVYRGDCIPADPDKTEIKSHFEYNAIHNIKLKRQWVVDDGLLRQPKSQQLGYEYEAERPHVLDKIVWKDVDATGNAPGAGTDHEYAFDVAGNLLTSGIGTQLRQHTWTPEGWLRSLREPATLPMDPPVASYLYDAAGMRVRKTLNGGPDTTYYAGALATLHTDRLSHHVFVGAARVATAVEVTPGALERYYYLTDHHGTTATLVDDLGRPLQHTTVAPYGEVVLDDVSDAPSTPAGGPAIDQRILFTTKELDGESGYSYFGARYLDHATGMWLSPDPDMMWLRQGPVGLNVYQYAGWNPIRFTDPDGRCFENCNQSRAERAAIVNAFVSQDTLEATAEAGETGLERTGDVLVGIGNGIRQGPADGFGMAGLAVVDAVDSTMEPLATMSVWGVNAEDATAVAAGLGNTAVAVSNVGLSVAPANGGGGKGGGSSGAGARPSLPAPRGNKGVPSGQPAPQGTFHATPEGVVMTPNPKYKIPSGYVENPHHRGGSYGVIENGKFVEKLRIDPATPPGRKGPNESHYHKNGKGTHYSPAPGERNPGFQ